MNAIQSLLLVVDAYRAARNVGDARVSTLVFNDGSRIKGLRDGRDLGVLTAQRAIRWLSDNWPDNADWPADVPRPDRRRIVDAAPSADLPAVCSTQHIAD